MMWYKAAWRDAVEGGKGVLAKPLGRFVEGFKVVSSTLTDEKPNQNGNAPRFTVIHEEKSAVNRISWNPNVVSGSWAAAATVSGLVRIEDLGVD
jgi:transcription factor C subunit 6